MQSSTLESALAPAAPTRVDSRIELQDREIQKCIVSLLDSVRDFPCDPIAETL
jgi:hypothetical protein